MNSEDLGMVIAVIVFSFLGHVAWTFAFYVLDHLVVAWV